MNETKFQFGNVVVVEVGLIGVIVKSWLNCYRGASYEVYVRSFNKVIEYKEDDIRHFVYDKILEDDQ